MKQKGKHYRMATKLAVFRGAVDDSDQLIEQANKKLAEIEAQGGQYVDSHWSTAGSSRLNATLVIVYEDSGAPTSQADRTERARAF